MNPDRTPDTAPYRHTTIARLARDKASQSPDEVAIFLENGEHITFGSIYEEAQTLAAALADLGCSAGDVVSFQLPNWREAVSLDLAACSLGMVVNPIIPIYRDKELRFILADNAAKVLFIPDSFRGYDFPAMIHRLKPELPDLETVVVVGGEHSRSDGFVSLSSLMEKARGNTVEPAAVDPDSVKIIMYTSGTTGNPKAVCHSHNTLARALDNGAEGWGLGAGDIMLMPSPVTHITGFVNGIELPFFNACQTAFMEQWDVNLAVDYIKQLGATACLSATPFLQELVSTCRDSGETLPTMRFFACGGASVPPSLIYNTHRYLAKCRSFRVYGSTEAPLVTVGFLDPEQERLAAETDGGIYNWEVRVVDDEGKVLAPGEDGEIVVRGPAMMLGYKEVSQTASAVDGDGFFHTGDIGHVTADNAIVITDRKKDIIIRGGENLSAREIEDVLHTHPAIQQAAAVAMPHERLGEGVCACLVLAPGHQSLTLDDLKGFLAESGLAKQKWPQRLELRDSFPMTASGKVRKDVLRREVKARVESEG